MKRTFIVFLLAMILVLVTGCKEKESQMNLHKRLALGSNFSLIIDDQGHLFGMGSHMYGVLANGVSNFEMTISPISLMDNFQLENDEVFVSVHAGNHHAVALTSKNRVFTWGNYLLKGTNPSEEDYSPSDITDSFNLNKDENIYQIVTGPAQTLILTTNGRLFGFGMNANSELLTKEINSSEDIIENLVSIPVDLTEYFELEDDQIIKISTNMALSKNHRLFVWATFGEEQSLSSVLDPTVKDITDEIEVLEDGEHIIDLPTDYTIKTSNNRYFSVGYYVEFGLENKVMLSYADHSRITSKDIGIRLMKIHSGNLLMIRSNGEILGFGMNENGNLGNSNTESAWNLIFLEDHYMIVEYRILYWDIEFMDREEVIMIDMSKTNTMILTSSGRLFGWGLNRSGELGLGHNSPSYQPTEIIIN